MRITAYRFGHMEIAGQAYSRDAIVFDDRVHSPWWRGQGHRLAIADLERVLAAAPACLVIGTGAYGVMQVPDAVAAALRAQGMELVVLKTAAAVAEYNRRLEQGDSVVGAFHLTC